MPKFTVGVEWVVCGEVEVEADSLDEAIDKIMYDETGQYDIDEIENDYVDDSFRVNRDCCFVEDENGITRGVRK